jgi:hypothetical protein
MKKISFLIISAVIIAIIYLYKISNDNCNEYTIIKVNNESTAKEFAEKIQNATASGLAKLKVSINGDQTSIKIMVPLLDGGNHIPWQNCIENKTANQNFFTFAGKDGFVYQVNVINVSDMLLKRHHANHELDEVFKNQHIYCFSLSDDIPIVDSLLFVDQLILHYKLDKYYFVYNP